MQILNRDFLTGLIVAAAAISLGAGFAPAPADRPGPDYFEACQAMQGEAAARGLGIGETGRDGKRLIRMRHWLLVMEKFQPVDAPTKAESDLLMKAFPK